MFDDDHTLKLARLDHSLTYRDVKYLTRILAERYADNGYTVRISALADIENHGTAPSIFRLGVFRLDSLCMVYALDMPSVLDWFGVLPKKSQRTFVQANVK
jgi:hypothetical protein